MSTFTDTSTECAICLSALDGARTITLSCGHKWHLACLQQQIESARPSHAKRLIFSGCRCAKCGAFCEHPELENLTRRTDALRARVDALVAEQLEADAPDAWREARHDATARARLVDEGRRTYAYYLCGGCDAPYFGGTVDCADEMEGELTTSEERLCNACSPKSQAVCSELAHRPSHVWKCRYCCNPSTFVCYANVHFCDSCHAKNSRRVRSRGRGTEPSTLEAIPCPGEGCPFPKPEGRDRHSNGPSLDCEQVYYCASCETCPSRHAFLENPGSRNFVVNPSGEEGLRGWRANNGRGYPPCNWTVEDSEIRVDENTRTNFVSSYQWCIASQTVPLRQYVRNPSAARLEVSAKYMGRTDCPSVFKMAAIVTNAQGREIHRAATSELAAPADFWEKTTLSIEPRKGQRLGRDVPASPVSSPLHWRRRQPKKRAKKGWRKTRDGWLRLDLPADSTLRVGVTHRPKECSMKSQPGDFLSVHYNATLFSNDKEFDSSILREEPFVFQIGRKQMNEGWEKGLLSMCVGEQRKLVVPSGLAYGDVGGYGSESMNRIQPGATLVYHVELLAILDAEAAAPHMVWGL
ncbi:hypothetical protein ACHAXT_004927 [Thalassiosira profunda]